MYVMFPDEMDKEREVQHAYYSLKMLPGEIGSAGVARDPMVWFKEGFQRPLTAKAARGCDRPDCMDAWFRFSNLSFVDENIPRRAGILVWNVIGKNGCSRPRLLKP